MSSNRFQRRAARAKERAKGKVVLGRVEDIVQREDDIAKKRADLTTMLNDLAESNLLVEDKLDQMLDLFAEAVHAARSRAGSPIAAIKESMQRFDEGEAPSIPDGEKDAIDDVLGQEFGKHRESFINVKWCGCTEETVDEIVATEVVTRVMLRTDVALAIACCDRVALACEVARKSGSDLVEAAHATFRATLGAPKAREVRARLLEAGWNGATEATLEDLVCENVLSTLDHWIEIAHSFGILQESAHTQEAEAGFMRRWEPVYKDTATRHKVNVTVRNACANVLAADPDLQMGILDIANLVRKKFKEFDQDGEGWVKFRRMLVRFGWKGCSEDTFDDAILTEMLVEHRRRVEERFGSGEWLRRAEQALARAQEQGHLEGLERMLSWLRVSARAPVSGEANGGTDGAQAALDKMGVKGKVLDVPAGRLVLTARTFDHALMRAGRQLWEKTYAKGMNDEKAWAALAGEPVLAAETARFAAKWAVHAFQRMTSSHTYASYCMAMDVSPEVLTPVEELTRLELRQHLAALQTQRSATESELYMIECRIENVKKRLAPRSKRRGAPSPARAERSGQPRPTKTQMALIREGVRPGLFTGSGGGKIVADPRTIRSMVAQKLAFKPDNIFALDWRCKAYLTRAAFALAGAEPPSKHPCDNDKPWP